LSRAKKPVPDNRLPKPARARGGDCPQVPAFSFAYLTANKRYALDGVSDASARRELAANIVDRLCEICQRDWKHWYSLPKERGIESLPMHRINFSPSAAAPTPDKKILVFRVKGHAGSDARILGMREDGCPILFIIGFDFDHSAYDH
jgi:hypothetical protein